MVLCGCRRWSGVSDGSWIVLAGLERGSGRGPADADATDTVAVVWATFIFTEPWVHWSVLCLGCLGIILLRCCRLVVPLSLCLDAAN